MSKALKKTFLTKVFSNYTLSTFGQKLIKEKSRKKLLLFMGPPGSGKGSIGNEISKNIPSQIIDIGKWLRELEKNQCRQQICIGQLANDSFVTEWTIENIANAVSNKQNDIVILDGFPRTLSQTYSFLHWLSNNQGTESFSIVRFHVTKNFIEKYALNRTFCPMCKKQYAQVDGSPYQSKISNQCDDCGLELKKRTDDTKKTITKRINQYEKEIPKIAGILEKNPLAEKINLCIFCTKSNPLEQQIKDFKEIIAEDNESI